MNVIDHDYDSICTVRNKEWSAQTAKCSNERCHEKSVFGVSDKVILKPACSATETS